MEAKSIHTLNCDNCGIAFYSEEAFPKPQYCDGCLRVDKAAQAEAYKEIGEWLDKNMVGSCCDPDECLHFAIYYGDFILLKQGKMPTEVK